MGGGSAAGTQNIPAGTPPLSLSLSLSLSLTHSLSLSLSPLSRPIFTLFTPLVATLHKINTLVSEPLFILLISHL